MITTSFSRNMPLTPSQLPLPFRDSQIGILLFGIILAGSELPIVMT